MDKSKPTEDQIESLVDTLRGFTRAYPEDVFTPLTDADRKQMGSLLEDTMRRIRREGVQQ